MKLEKLRDQKKIKDHIWFLLNNVNKPIVVLNKDGTIYEVNSSFEKAFGKIEAHTICELLDRKSSNLWNGFLKDAEEKEQTDFDISMLLTRNTMASVKVQLLYCKIREKIIAMFSSPTNERKKLEIRCLQALRKSDNLMIITNPHGIICDMNDLSDEFFNLPREYFVGQSIHKLITLFSDSPLESENYVEKVKEDGYAEVIKQYKLSTEDIKYYKITAFFDEETFMYITRITNVTEKIQLEQQLAHQRSLSEVGQLAASIAHEIRNPMTTLKGFTQLLRTTATEESKKYLNVIDDEIIRMESILSEMLVLSKPSSNEKTFLSLKTILLDITEIISPKAGLEGITIIHTDAIFPEALIYGNAAKLKQVLLNLFKNALEAMNPGGILSIELKEDDGRFKLTLADTGKGMSTTQLKQIFMPFFTTRSEGTGLGLPFVMKTIDEHGGTVAVESEEGEGTRFTLSFPCAITHAPNGIAEEAILPESSWLA